MNRSRALSLVCSVLLATPFALAQNPGPSMQPDGPHRGEMRGGPEGGQGMGILPHGMWWKNPDTIKDLNISADQQKQLDKIMLDSRVQLIQQHASLEEEQLRLEPLLNASPFDQARAFAQISHIADMRAELEKTNARMLLSLRGVLTAEQWTRLQAERQARHQSQGPEGRRPNWHRGPQGTPDGPSPPAGENNE